MKQQKKNKFFTFIWSFMPGAAEMYMGFMKNGLSLMAIFFLTFLIPFTWRMEGISLLFAALVWFYSFFHARNLAACDEEMFESIPDEFIWEAFLHGRNLKISNPVLKKWGAAILIIAGVTLLWQNVSSILYRLIPDRLWDNLAPLVSQVPQVVIAVLIILIGIKMIMGKKEEINGEGE